MSFFVYLETREETKGLTLQNERLSFNKYSPKAAYPYDYTEICVPSISSVLKISFCVEGGVYLFSSN